jgi:hypothetical protein
MRLWNTTKHTTAYKALEFLSQHACRGVNINDAFVLWEMISKSIGAAKSRLPFCMHKIGHIERGEPQHMLSKESNLDDTMMHIWSSGVSYQISGTLKILAFNLY